MGTKGAYSVTGNMIICIFKKAQKQEYRNTLIILGLDLLIRDENEFR